MGRLGVKRKVADLAGRDSVQFALFVLAALALRYASFGDLSRHADETFYFLVGQRMHDGVLPYVGVWDRKPLGLFLIYYLIASVSKSVWAYQLVACLLAGVTAMLICAMVKPWSGLRGGLLAGLGYLVMLGPFEGATGQAPDFYNPLICGAALLLFRERARLARGEAGWPLWCAMALCGLALTIKQTTLFEALFLGAYGLVSLARAGVGPGRLVRIACLCGIIGVLPTVSIALFYWTAGHWHEFWQAMVLSNLAKSREGEEAWRALSIAVRSAPWLALAGWGLSRGSVNSGVRIFVALWLTAALAGFLAVPNFYGHYILPVLVPLSVAAGFAFGRLDRWLVPAAVVAIYSLVWYNPVDFAGARGSTRSMEAMTRLIRNHDRGGGLLVFDGPVYLYATAGKPFLSPLVFPQHLNHAIERNVSHLDTRAEIDRIVAAGPGVIVMSRWPRSAPVNWYSRQRVLDYARGQCRLVSIEMMGEPPLRYEFVIFGDCRGAGPRHSDKKPAEPVG